MTKTYTVTIRGYHGEIVNISTIECGPNSDPAERAIDEIFGDDLNGIHVSCVSEVV